MRCRILALALLARRSLGEGGALSIAIIVLTLCPYTTILAAEHNNSITSNSVINASGITRAEAIYRLMESDPELRERVVWYRTNMPPLPLFHDVPQEDALAPYLEVAFEEGIISGNRERLFHPRDSLRIEEAHAMIQRLRGGGDSLQVGDNVIFFVQPISHESFLALLQGPSPYPSPSGRGNLPPAGRPTVPTTIPAPPADLFAITLPTLGIERLTVTHPKDPLTHAGILEPLKNGVGHLFGFPGGGGKVFIYGHSSGYPWDLSEYTRIFRKVNRLTVGDPIHIAYQGQRFTYQVTGKERVLANDLRLFQEDGEEEELILYTCWPPDSTSERLLVRARPVK